MHIYDIMIETYLAYIKCETVRVIKLPFQWVMYKGDSIELSPFCYGLFPPLTRQSSIRGDDSSIGTPYF